MPATKMIHTTLRIPAEEKRRLEELARQRGVTVSHAYRQGARLFLEQRPGGGAGAT